MRPRTLRYTLLLAIGVIVLASGALISQLVTHRYSVSLMEGAVAQAQNVSHKLALDSTEAVLQVFGIELVRIPEFNCCGYPMRNVDEKAYILPSVRNMAIAEKKGLDILVICNCCFASLQKAKNVLEKDSVLNDEFNTLLAKEGLTYHGTTRIRHYLTVLHEDVGITAIRNKLVNTCKGLKLSVIHGCHILRPG